MNKKSCQITTIFFDVGGVLVEDYVDRKIIDLANKYQKAPELMLQLRKQLRPLADLGQISDREFWLKVLQAVGIKAAADDWQIDHYEKAINGAIEIAKSLKQKGYRIAILSNDAKESSDLRRTKHHFDEIFDAVIISCHYGVIKPNPEIYRYALNKLKALPEQSLFIDDRMENIESSRNLGINSILFTNIDLLIEELKQLGINFD